MKHYEPLLSRASSHFFLRTWHCCFYAYIFGWTIFGIISLGIWLETFKQNLIKIWVIRLIEMEAKSPVYLGSEKSSKIREYT